MINTYIFSNITQQFRKFNHGIWDGLESHGRNAAEANGERFVIPGATFDKNQDGQRDDDHLADRVKQQNRVAILTHFYKVLIRKRNFGGEELLAFLQPHEAVDLPGADGDAYLKHHLVGVKDIEAPAAGNNVFRKAVSTRRAILENMKAQDLWPLD